MHSPNEKRTNSLCLNIFVRLVYIYPIHLMTFPIWNFFTSQCNKFGCNLTKNVLKIFQEVSSFLAPCHTSPTYTFILQCLGRLRYSYSILGTGNLQVLTKMLTVRLTLADFYMCSNHKHALSTPVQNSKFVAIPELACQQCFTQLYFCSFQVCHIVLVSLPRGQIQEIKHMLLMHLTHGLFLTWTQKSHYITDYILQYLHVI